MSHRMQFDELLEAVEGLPDDAQAELIGVVHRRLAERGRQRVAKDVRQGRAEFAEGKCSLSTPEDLMRELES